MDPVAARRPALQELKARLTESLLAEQDALLEAETGQTRAADELAAQARRSRGASDAGEAPPLTCPRRVPRRVRSCPSSRRRWRG